MITLLAAIDDFIAVKEAADRSPKTINWYKTFLTPFVAKFGNESIDSFTVRKIANWLKSQDGRPYTKFDRSKAIHYFFSWCVKAYGITDPTSAIPLPRIPEPEPKAIEVDDLNRLIEVAASNPRDMAILIILADCGLRASSLVNLSVDDIDFAAHTIAIRNDKRGKTRAVPFSLESERVLILWLKKRPTTTDRLFPSDDGKPLKYAGLREILRRLAVKAGFTTERYNLHSFRHFAAREYLRNGGSLPALARILGHQYIDTTTRYYAVFTLTELSDVHDQHSPLNSLKKGKEGI